MNARLQWVYVGVSPTTRLPFYVAAVDSNILNWTAAMELAERSGARLPSMEELGQIYSKRQSLEIAGSFDVSDSPLASWYWSSTRHGTYVWAARFTDGTRRLEPCEHQCSVRLVSDTGG
jgi:hypothetical protein